ncbi:hypothetical protein [Eubacterium xylanophilum]|uniref:hypothetical protein n=1 Tax=Eubacterium xylanophilum TaxID=39497 RepID=UPI000684B335|nr:hypothetical protein [Eubacterium xylanophilum]
MENNKYIRIAFTISFVILLAVVLMIPFTLKSEMERGKGAEPSATPVVASPPSAPIVDTTSAEEVDPEDKVFSFLQGPKSWEQRIAWSGKWSQEEHDGAKFGAFGCGFCCMANIYTTISSSATEGVYYSSSPIDIYKYSKKITHYPGGCAISWQQMSKVLRYAGCENRLRKKTTYARFKKSVKASQATLVVVSSDDSEIYWKNTSGHYVTIFLYNETDDTVFLADSGDPNHNRHRVPLKYIYKSLKKNNDYQYMPVYSYSEENDKWRHQGINGDWVAP